MCGIAGYFGKRTLPLSTVERMLSALRMRGPDAEHSMFWNAQLQRTDEAAPNALLHTRLSIIDPRPIGAGGQGTVFRAIQKSTRRKVAIKRLNRHASERDRRRSRDSAT